MDRNTEFSRVKKSQSVALLTTFQRLYLLVQLMALHNMDQEVLVRWMVTATLAKSEHGQVLPLLLLLQHQTTKFVQKKIEVSIADGSVSKKEAELKFSEETINHEVGSTFTAPTFSKATTANVTFTSDNEDVATVNSEGVISLGTEEGKAVIKATSAANDLFLEGSATCTIYVYHMNAYKQATSIESGKGYLLVAKRDGKTYYAMPLSTSATHGYVKATEYEEGTNEIKVKSTYDDEFVFTVEGDGYSIKDNQGRYYIQQGTYNSFNTANSPSAWTVEAQGDGTYKIAMNGYLYAVRSRYQHINWSLHHCTSQHCHAYAL